MTAFIVIGTVGGVIALITLLVGEVVDGLFGALDADTGGEVFCAPVIGSLLAAFGYGAALIMFATGVGAATGALGGLASGAVVGCQPHRWPLPKLDGAVAVPAGPSGGPVEFLRQAPNGRERLCHLDAAPPSSMAISCSGCSERCRTDGSAARCCAGS